MDMLTALFGGSIPLYMMIMIVTALMAAAFIFGIRVQSSVHFIWPKDFVSLTLYMVCAIDLIALRMIGIQLFEAWLWVPVLTAYLIGFFFSSIDCHIMLATPLLAAQRMPMGFIVPYWVGDEQFVQDQTNKALLKRLVFNIEHKIICNVRLEPDWEIPIRHPYLPMPKIKVLLVDSIIDEEPEIVREGKWIKCIRYTTRIVVAPASMHSKMDMMMIENAHATDVNENIRLSAELLKVKQSSYRESMAAAADLLCYATVDATPGMQILDFIRSDKDVKKERKKSRKEAEK